jgi:predicted Zn finger-like uncharacterized protein
MKFLCGNCKAKYQIADEKISGRTLKMKCRRCAHDIIIKGDAAPEAAVSAPVARPSVLSADFQRQVARGTSMPPAQELDQWHVAINDVPVGPIKKAEFQRKIASGAVRPDSLCWREGFDDWRPLKDVPELSALLRQPPPAPPPPGAVGRGIHRREGSRPRIMRVTAPRPTPPPAPAPTPSQRPAARSNVVPIGGRLGASAAPAFEDAILDEQARLSEPAFSVEPAAPPMPAAPMRPPERPAAKETRAPVPAPVAPFPKTDSRSDLPAVTRRTSSAPGTLPAASLPATPRPAAADLSADFDLPIGAPVVAAAPAVAGPVAVAAPISTPPAADVGRMSDSYEERPRRSLPIGAWIGIAGAIAFGIALAVMVGIKFIFVEPVQVAENDPRADEPVRDPGLDLSEADPPVVDDEVVEPENEADPAVEESRPRNSNTAMTNQAPQGSNMRELTAAERAILERASQGGVTPTLMVNDNIASEGGSSLRSLDETAIARVVSGNRPVLQRCFTTAIRGMPEAPTVRVNVELTISPGGRVSNVRASAAQPIGNLLSCVESSVQRWIFPRSNGATTTRFPVLFTGAS